MRHNVDKVVADLELLRDDALGDEVPTAAAWLTGAIETIRDLEARIVAHKSALNVAIAYANGDLPIATHEADEEVAGCRIVLEEG